MFRFFGPTCSIDAFAGTLMGITNMIATIPGFLSPSVVGILTHGNVSLYIIDIIAMFCVGLRESSFYCLSNTRVLA